MKKYLLFFLVLLLVSSCIPSKNVIYFQGDVSQNENIERVNNIPYKLQINDILSVQINATDSKLTESFQKGQSSGNAVGIGGGQGQGAGYFSGYSVDMYGNIRLPILGEINVLGYTIQEVRKKIELELKKYFKKENDLFVTVKLFGINYTILGEVGSAGPNVIFQNRVSIVEAIANSGDITELGNRKEVEIYRNTISGVKKYTIDLTTIDAFNSDVFYIKPNDYIYVRPLKQKFWGTGTTGLQSLTTFVSIFTLITSTIVLARNF
jgi:polysaccharide export outer membrane protein